MKNVYIDDIDVTENDSRRSVFGKTKQLLQEIMSQHGLDTETS